MLPPNKVRLNKKSTTLRLTMIFKQPLNLKFLWIACDIRNHRVNNVLNVNNDFSTK